MRKSFQLGRSQTLRLLLSALLLPSFAMAIPQTIHASIESSNQATIAEQYLLAAANAERAQRGLSQLRRDPQLARAALAHAQQMADHQQISHQFPGEAELADRGARAGVSFSTISENVAEAPNVPQIHDMWMRSEHHRDNLLDPRIDSAGISVISRNGEFYAVEDFAKTVRSVSLEDQESAIATLVAASGHIALTTDREKISAARKTCAMSTGYAGAVQPWFIMRFTSGSLSELPEQLKTRMDSGRYHVAAVGACASPAQSPFTSYNLAVLLYP